MNSKLFPNQLVSGVRAHELNEAGPDFTADFVGRGGGVQPCGFGEAGRASPTMPAFARRLDRNIKRGDSQPRRRGDGSRVVGRRNRQYGIRALSGSNLAAGVQIAGGTPEFFTNNNLPIGTGRGYEEAEAAGASRVIVIGATVADVLFPVTQRSIRYLITQTAQQAGIKKRVSAQILRDTCAVRQLRRGEAIERVLQRLGLSETTWEDAKVKYLTLSARSI